MPTYEYQCQNCDYLFEEYQSITAQRLKKCPECKKMKLQRLIGGGGGLIFKGSGFYITDYRSDSYKAAAKKDSNSNSSSGEKKKSSDSAKEASGSSKSKVE